MKVRVHGVSVSARIGLGLAVSCAPMLAQAHAPLKGASYLYSGLVHPLTSLEDLLPILAFGLLVGQQLRLKRNEWMAGAFLGAFVIGAVSAWWLPFVPGTGALNLYAPIILGGAVLAAWSPPAPLAYAFALAFGLTLGHASGLTPDAGVSPVPFTLGLTTCVVLTIGYLSMITLNLLSKDVGWITIGVRVIGSWITAVGILVLANHYR